MENKINIILVDDHRMFLDGLYALLNENENLIIKATAKNGKEVLDLLRKDNSIDLLITDISMPEIDGIELNKIIKKKYPKLKVIVLSMYKQSSIMAKLVRDDVDGYLLKNADIDELLYAIKSVMNNKKYFSKSVKDEFMESMFSPRAIKNTFIKLTKREKEVLKLIANENTNEEIAEKLFLSLYTVETHRKNILKKVNAKNTAGIVKYAIQHGIV